MSEMPRIKVTPPGENAKKIIEMDEKYIMTATKLSPIVVKRASGALVEDVDGNTYLDFTCGASVTNLGHCPPNVVEAIKAQVEKVMHFAGTDFYYEYQAKLAKKLTEITPGSFPKKVFFVNSGAESVEAAIKCCKWSTQRKRFISFMGAFHGRTMGAVSLTGSKPVHRNRYMPMMPGVTHIPYAYCYRCPYKLTYPDCDIWCAKILDELYFNSFLPPDEVAALFFECVQGEGGYIVPPIEFIPELARIMKKHGILMVDDEVQAGFGRTGKLFACEHYGVEPDIITLAKGMGSGVPIGAIVAKAELDFGAPGAHSNTYGGNLLCCASALATVEEILDKNLPQNAQRLGEQVRQRLNELYDKYELIGDIRGLGLMTATEFVKDRNTKEYASQEAHEIVVEAYKRGLLLLPCGKSSVRYIPSLNIPEDQLQKGFDILEEAIKAVTK
ncbi:acetyl ornithine aminotransferase family protein [[Eubacterium] cellulosolvens]